MTDHTRDDSKLDDIGTELKGKGQQVAGDLTGDEKLRARGKGNEIKGKLGQAAEDVKDVARDAVNEVTDRPRR